MIRIYIESEHDEEKCKFFSSLGFFFKCEIQIFMRQVHAIVPIEWEELEKKWQLFFKLNPFQSWPSAAKDD